MRKAYSFLDSWQPLCLRLHHLTKFWKPWEQWKDSLEVGSVALKSSILIVIKDQANGKEIKFLSAPRSRLISSRVQQASIHLTPTAPGAFCSTSNPSVYPILIQAKNWFSISNVKFFLLSFTLLSCLTYLPKYLSCLFFFDEVCHKILWGLCLLCVAFIEKYKKGCSILSRCSILSDVYKTSCVNRSC